MPCLFDDVKSIFRLSEKRENTQPEKSMSIKKQPENSGCFFGFAFNRIAKQQKYKHFEHRLNLPARQ